MEHNLSTPKTRDYMFDNFKAILIYLVVVGHMIDTYHVPSRAYTILYYFIYFFHMPAFIFITGYFSKNVNKCRETAFSKFLIPYILLNVLSYIQYLYLYEGSNPEKFYLFKAPLGVWFLLGVFIWKLTLKDLVKIRFILPLAFLFGILSGVGTEFGEYLALGRIFALGPFFLLGYFTTSSHVEKIRKIPKVIPIALLLVIIGVAFYFVLGDVMPKGPILYRKPYRRSMIMEDTQSRIILYFIAISMIGIMINLVSNKKTLLTNLGSKTLTVYVIHLFIIRTLDEYIFFEHNKILYGIYILGGAALITFVCSRNIFMFLYDKITQFVTYIIFKDNRDS